jgi:hypothetical protein
LSATQKEIALIFDFDDTLTDDSTAAFIESVGNDPQEFYNEVSKRVATGWDPPLAYLNLLCDEVAKGSFPKLTKSHFETFGKGLKLYTGVQDCLKTLRTLFELRLGSSA